MLSVYSFLLERKCTSILIHVIYIKIDQNVCLFFHNWKGSTCVYLFMLFNSKLIKLSVIPIGKEENKPIYFKMDRTVCLFIPIIKEIHKPFIS